MKKLIKRILPEDFVAKPELTQKKTAVCIFHMYPPIHNAGAEIMAHTLNLYLIKRGWTVYVILPEFPKKEVEGVKIIEFSEKKKIEEVVQKASFLVSHLRYSELTVSTAKEAKKPAVMLIHNSFQIPWILSFLKMVPKEQLHFIYNSQWIKNFYRKWEIDGPVLYPPVSVKDYEIKTNRKYVTLVNCIEDKGGDVLVKLAKAMPDVEFLGVQGGYGIQVIEKGLPNLHYMKNTPDTDKFYSQTDIILMPSSYESWGRVAVESMSIGIPVIAHPTPGLKESLGEAGLFANRDKIHQWVSLIRRLKTDPWFYGMKSEEGRIRAKQLDPEPQLKETEAWLKSL
jgi:glycosyltransferase involved in cell wall biosynthesis